MEVCSRRGILWTASDLISFESYGTAPTAFMQRGAAFGGPQIGHKRLPMQSQSLPTGGLAKFRILLMPMSGTTKTAVLQANCAFGKCPPRTDRQMGFGFSYESSGSEFSGEAGGRIIYISMRPGVSTPAGTPTQEHTPHSEEPPSS